MQVGRKRRIDNFDGQWSFMFNVIIEILDLRKITLIGRQCATGGKRLTSLEGRVACLYSRGAPPWITAHTRVC